MCVRACLTMALAADHLINNANAPLFAIGSSLTISCCSSSTLARSSRFSKAARAGSNSARSARVAARAAAKPRSTPASSASSSAHHGHAPRPPAAAAAAPPAPAPAAEVAAAPAAPPPPNSFAQRAPTAPQAVLMPRAAHATESRCCCGRGRWMDGDGLQRNDCRSSSSSRDGDDAAPPMMLPPAPTRGTVRYGAIAPGLIVAFTRTHIGLLDGRRGCCCSILSIGMMAEEHRCCLRDSVCTAA